MEQSENNTRYTVRHISNNSPIDLQKVMEDIPGCNWLMLSSYGNFKMYTGEYGFAFLILRDDYKVNSDPRSAFIVLVELNEETIDHKDTNVIISYSLRYSHINLSSHGMLAFDRSGCFYCYDDFKNIKELTGIDIHKLVVEEKNKITEKEKSYVRETMDLFKILIFQRENKAIIRESVEKALLPFMMYTPPVTYDVYKFIAHNITNNFELHENIIDFLNRRKGLFIDMLNSLDFYQELYNDKYVGEGILKCTDDILVSDSPFSDTKLVFYKAVEGTNNKLYASISKPRLAIYKVSDDKYVRITVKDSMNRTNMANLHKEILSNYVLCKHTHREDSYVLFDFNNAEYELISCIDDKEFHETVNALSDNGSMIRAWEMIGSAKTDCLHQFEVINESFVHNIDIELSND